MGKPPGNVNNVMRDVAATVRVTISELLRRNGLPMSSLLKATEFFFSSYFLHSQLGNACLLYAYPFNYPDYTVRLTQFNCISIRMLLLHVDLHNNNDQAPTQLSRGKGRGAHSFWHP